MRYACYQLNSFISEIIQHIRFLKNNTASCINEINPIIIKSCHLYLVEPTEHIIKLILQTGVINWQFQTSVFTPIYEVKHQIIDQLVK